MPRVLPQRYAKLPLPATTRPDGVPRLRWPSQAALLRRLVCGACRSAVLVGDVPTAANPLVTVTCLMCTRPAVELQSDAFREPTPLPPEPTPKRGRPRKETRP